MGKDESTDPSAPPLLDRLSPTADTDMRSPLVTSPDSSSAPSPVHYTVDTAITSADVQSDAALWRDLLGRARGNHNQAAQWMQQIGANVPLAARAAHEVPGVKPEGPNSNDLDVRAADAGAPATFFCPISFKVFRDPVLAPTGQTYERRYIERWLAQGNSRCPATGQRMNRPITLTPNVTLRKSMEEWAEKNAPWMLAGDGHLKPIPPEDDFATPRRGGIGGRTSPSDPDLALAIRLQQEEMTRMRGPPQGAPQGPLPPFTRNPVGPTPPPSLPQRARHYIQPAPAAKPRSLLPLLLLLTELAYIATYLTSMGLNGWAFEDLKLNPMAGGSASTLTTLGAVDYDEIVYHHQWWRFLAAPFVCSGLIQLFCMSTCLWTFGKYLERVLLVPTLAVPAVYMVSGIAGGLASANLAVDRVTVTCTAAICGLVGGVWADQLIHWTRYRHHWLTLPLLTAITAVLAILGLVPLMNNFAHIAGFVAGFLACLIALLNKRTDGSPRRHVGWQLILQLVAAVLLIGMLAIAIVGLSMRSHVGQECSWCDDFACPRIRWWDCQPASTISAGISPVAESSSPVSEATPASSGNSNDTTLVTYG